MNVELGNEPVGEHVIVRLAGVSGSDEIAMAFHVATIPLGRAMVRWPPEPKLRTGHI